ncbi:hypothetical protein [Tessaracoccus defluvii]|uniref:Uncharacterized protein n=1 Tax=Tessaracoccus defluvii TaxID=1285901 RepID=A0A7H0H7T8_9ACTN|nr:hypothetical protein [Tessaracoccus defluvii]QNP56604.1 hypothetical protein H9L22_04125 [Tessaracoccus defluvii]
MSRRYPPDLPPGEVGYGEPARAATPEAAALKEIVDGFSKAVRRRAEVAHVWCGSSGCKRALLVVYRVRAEFLAVPAGVRMTPEDRLEPGEAQGYWGMAPPFLLGKTWDLVSVACRCGAGPMMIDVLRLVLTLNTSGARDLTPRMNPDVVRPLPLPRPRALSVEEKAETLESFDHGGFVGIGES